MTLKHHVDLGEIDRLVLSSIQSSLFESAAIPEIVISSPGDPAIADDTAKISYTDIDVDLAAVTCSANKEYDDLLQQIRLREFQNRYTVILFYNARTPRRMTVYKGCSIANNIYRLLSCFYNSRHDYERGPTQFATATIVAANELAEYLRLIYISHASATNMLALMRDIRNHAMAAGENKKSSQIKAALGIEP